MSNNRLNYFSSGLGAVTSVDLHVCGVAALLAMYEVCELPDENIQAWETATLLLMVPAAIRLSVAQYALAGNVKDHLPKNLIRTFVKPSNIFWEFNEVFMSASQKLIAAHLLAFGIVFDVLLGVLGMGAIWGASQAFGLREDKSSLFSSLTIAGYCLSGLRYGLCYLNAYHKRNYTSKERATIFQAFEVGLCSLTDAAYYFQNQELPSTRVDVSEIRTGLLATDRACAQLTSCEKVALYIGLVLNVTTRGCLEILGGTAALWGITGAAHLRNDDTLVDGGIVPSIGVVFSSIIACKFFMTAYSKLICSEHASGNTKAIDNVVAHFDKPLVLFSVNITSSTNENEQRSCSEDFGDYKSPIDGGGFCQRKSDIRRPVQNFIHDSLYVPQDSAGSDQRTYSGDFGDYEGFKSSVI
jgi:hypothetical protein